MDLAGVVPPLSPNLFFTPGASISLGPLSLPPPLYPRRVERTLKAEAYVKIVNDLYGEADRAFRPIKYELDTMWGLYTNKYNWRKYDWQFRGWLPIIQRMVDMKQAFLEDALRRSNNQWFTIDPKRSYLPDERFADIFYRILQVHLDEMKYIYGKEDDIAGGLSAQLVMAQLGFVCPKVTVERNRSGYLRHRVDWCRPWDVRADQLGRGKYTFQRTIMDLTDFQKIADMPGSPFERAAVFAIQEGYFPTQDDESAYLKEGLSAESRSQHRKLVKLVEARMDVDDPQTGKRIHDDVILVVANDKHLVRGPDAIPYPLGRYPLWMATIRKTPFTVYGSPPTWGVSRMAYGATELLNLFMDSLLLESVPIYEAETQAFVNPLQVRTGIQPGKIFWRKRGVEQLLKRVDTGALSPNLVPGLRLLNTELGNTISPQLELGSPTGERVSATESKIKHDLLSKVTLSQVNRLQNGLLEPTLERMLQNDLYWRRQWRGDPLIESVLTEHEIVLLESMTDLERMKIIEGLALKVTGISGMIERESQIDALDQFINRAGRIAQSVPELAGIPWLSMFALYARYLSVPDELQDYMDRVAIQSNMQKAMQSMEPQPQPGQMARMNGANGGQAPQFQLPQQQAQFTGPNGYQQ